jgi:small subunit ribosomal protein S21|tara:strand:+ start:605 stop:877 length:273 start_codon:yes stop_codon:yes gene_type:complete
MEVQLLKKNNFKPNGNPMNDGCRVEVRNGDVTGAMRRFKKKVQEAGIIQEVRDRQEFVKPSKKRAKAKKAGIARWKKQLSKDEINTPRLY